MTYYCTVHKDEDHQFLMGNLLGPCTEHMVFDSGYDIDEMRSIVQYHPWKVIWVMEKDSKAKFGYKFSHLYGIPR
jgi:hypothetical protein